jgi:hypothetical protein
VGRRHGPGRGRQWRGRINGISLSLFKHGYNTVVDGKECTVVFLFSAFASSTLEGSTYSTYISIFTRSEYGYREPSNTTSGGFPCAGL